MCYSWWRFESKDHELLTGVVRVKAKSLLMMPVISVRILLPQELWDSVEFRIFCSEACSRMDFPSCNFVGTLGFVGRSGHRKSRRMTGRRKRSFKILEAVHAVRLACCNFEFGIHQAFRICSSFAVVAVRFDDLVVNSGYSPVRTRRYGYAQNSIHHDRRVPGSW